MKRGPRKKPVQQISDENLMKHLELRHGGDLKLEFTVEPGRTERRLVDRVTWEIYHDTMHRISVTGYSHWHGNQEDET